MYPSADQVARAVVAACRLTGDGPMATCMRQPSRARNIAMQALMDRFPDATRQTLARLVGYSRPAFHLRHIQCRSRWPDKVRPALRPAKLTHFRRSQADWMCLHSTNR